MSRPSCTSCTALSLALSFAVAGCGTIYTRTYSPRRSYYEKPVEKQEPLSADLTAPAQSSGGGQAPANLPGSPTGVVPATPPEGSLDGGAPVIPGL